MSIISKKTLLSFKQSFLLFFSLLSTPKMGSARIKNRCKSKIIKRGAKKCVRVTSVKIAKIIQIKPIIWRIWNNNCTENRGLDNIARN